MDWIELDDCEVTCIIGILDRERVETQRVGVEIRLGLDLDGAAGGDLSASVNYADVLEQVTFLLQEGRWRLLESVGAAICRLMLAPPAPGEERAQVQAVELRLRKPDVLAPRATPAVVLSRARSWCDLQARGGGDGLTVETLQETEARGAYRLQLASGARWAAPDEVSILVLAGEVEVDGRRAGAGDQLPTGTLHTSGDRPAALLVTGVSLT